MLTSAHLFAGAGGDTEGAIASNYQPLWSIEQDKHAAAIYRKRFPDVKLIQSDIKELSDEFVLGLPIPDVIIAGCPCPDFSVAGKRDGLKGVRGELFFEFIRILRLLQPASFVFENVEGILDIDQGKAFSQVIQSFGQLGYCCTWQVRDGNRFVPQNRRRLFCVGLHRKCLE